MTARTVLAAATLFAAMSSSARVARVVRAAEPEDCDAVYYGFGVPRDHAKAIACYRAQADWLMVAIMQTNGEGTPVDLAGARVSLGRLEFKDADGEALERIIDKREADPNANGRRVDFCADVANTTNSVDTCRTREGNENTRRGDMRLDRLRSALDARARPMFDRARKAFDKFVKAEGARAYQQYVDGTVRNQAAMDQEALARRNFMAAVQKVTTGPAARLAGGRLFPEADKQLNVVYRQAIDAYAKSFADDDVKDYKAKSRAAQQAWIRYRNAMGSLAGVRWPNQPDVQDRTRALVTEDRIRELGDAR